MRASPPAASRWLLAPLLLLVVAPGKAADGDATAAAAAACSFDEFMLDLEDGTLGPDQREACEAFLHLMPEPLGNMVVKGACRGEQRCEWVALLRQIVETANCRDPASQNGSGDLFRPGQHNFT
jgi:hypothetical protein